MTTWKGTEASDVESTKGGLIARKASRHTVLCKQSSGAEQRPRGPKDHQCPEGCVYPSHLRAHPPSSAWLLSSLLLSRRGPPGLKHILISVWSWRSIYTILSKTEKVMKWCLMERYVFWFLQCTPPQSLVHSNSLWLLKYFIYVFIWLHQVLVAACGISFPLGLNLGPLLWECKVLETGPPGKSPFQFFSLIFFEAKNILSK